VVAAAAAATELARGATAAGSLGSFISVCGFSHRAPDDPIVFPGRPGLSHDHSFVGSVSTNASSTVASLRAGGTTCTRKADTAAYWAPTLLDDGNSVAPAAAAVYYTRRTTARVRPFPPGLRIVAGNSHAGTLQSEGVTFWDCGLIKTTFYGPMARPAAPAPPGASAVPRCPAATMLQLHVEFPDCWNGKSLDSRDHASHMSYSAGGACPKGYPVAVPALALVYQYPPLADGAVALSSGGVYSGHADFMNAWNQRALTMLVDRCLNARRDCGTGT
jgi:hypothetical protein